MNIRQTLERLEVLGEVDLGLIYPDVRDMAHVDGDLFLASLRNVEKGSDFFLKSITGFGKTMDEAIADLWHNATTYDDEWKYLVVDAYRETRRQTKWVDGIGWVPVERG